MLRILNYFAKSNAVPIDVTEHELTNSIPAVF
jgi:hypothetical protein